LRGWASDGCNIGYVFEVRGGGVEIPAEPKKKKKKAHRCPAAAVRAMIKDLGENKESQNKEAKTRISNVNIQGREGENYVGPRYTLKNRANQNTAAI